MRPLNKIFLGAAPNDLTGTKLRPAGGALNENFTEIEAAIASLSGLNLVAGPVAKLAPGANPTASLTGTAPNLTLNLGLPEGAAGAGAPASADILAIAEKGRLERALSAAGVPEEPSLILDFIRGVHFASKSAIAASIITIIAALGGVSSFARASTGTYWDSDGLLKTAANNVPRMEYDPLTRLPQGLLYERVARTNSNTYSDQIDHSSYSKARCSVVADSGPDPFGTLTMDKVVEDATPANSHFVNRNVGMGSGNASEQCFSVFFRAAERTRIRLYITDFDTLGRIISCDFNPAAGTASFNGAAGGAVNGSAGIIDCGGGLYRLWMTGTLGGGTSTQPRIYMLDGAGAAVYNGDGVSGFFTSGWQLEIGSSPSSYIPTVASAVARAADVLTIDKALWLGAAAGGVMTVAFEADTLAISSGIVYPLTIQNAGSDFVSIRESASVGGWDFYTSVSSAGIINSGGYISTIATRMRFAFGLDASSWAFAANNALTYTGGATTLPTGLDRLVFGNLMGHIRRVIVWPQRLSNTKVQALSNQAAWS